MIRLNSTIKELSEKLQKKEVTPSEVLNTYITQTKKVNPKIKAFLNISEKEAKTEAAKAKVGKSKLSGIPVGIKDVILTRGIETTAASKMLSGYIPLENATVVERLKKAGAVIIGKNNCDAWAHGSSTENSDFEPTKNPWDITRVPGGSSGGSAAAVAAREVPYAIGTDTGGSIRQPAGFCGVVGLKPTYGLVSRYGLIAMASSLDCPGPITRTVYDSAIVLDVIAGADDKDSTSKAAVRKDYFKDIKKGVKGLKIGIPKEYFGEGLDPEVGKAVMVVADELRKAGAEIIDVSLPNTEYGIATYYVIQPAEVSSNLGRYDGIKYGHSARESKNLINHYFKSRSEGFGDEAKRRIMLGTFVLSAGYYDAYYEQAMKVRTLIKEDFEKAFTQCDVILAPTSPTTAFKFGEHTKDPLSMYLEDAYTVNMNLAGVPAISIPCGFSEKNLPIGMQLVGPHFAEDMLFRAGHAYEEITKDADWRKKEPRIS
ncbi:MAG: Asp-tRNA(Asn)/Glu-tRNA(Gln) amidotransferase subunit GatA [Patescibacteria group bacterium]|nr:Asp-tRNA(Asn)/Glu-tRNA(Gln) amidotransferase subunit GatA [Patescibacteria group bacterium]